MKPRTLFLLAILTLAVLALLLNLRILRQEPDPPRARPPSAEERFEALKKYADDNATSAFEYASACEAKGDLVSAEEYYMKAIKQGGGYPKATEHLRAAFAPAKLREAGDDPGRLDAVVGWLQKSGMDDAARALATRVLDQAPGSPNSRRVLNVGGPESGLARVEFDEFLLARGLKKVDLSEHELNVLGQLWKTCRDFRVFDKDLVCLDTTPATPFFLIMERSKNYNADLMLVAFSDVCVTFYESFTAVYGDLFDAATIARSDVCPVYIFASRDRYAEIREVPQWSGGDFSAKSGRISLYKDSNELYETLFHLFTHAVVHHAWLRRGEIAGKLSDTEMAWFSEGLSAYMEVFKRDATGGFILGEVSPRQMPFIRKLIVDGKATRLSEFMGVTCAAYAEKSNEDIYRQRTTAEAWALVYFLNKYENGKYREKFHAYFALEIAGKGGLEGAKSCFGDLDALDAEFTGYFKNLR